MTAKEQLEEAIAKVLIDALSLEGKDGLKEFEDRLAQEQREEWDRELKDFHEKREKEKSEEPSKWVTRLEEAQNQPLRAPQVRDAFYIGKKSKAPMTLMEGERPCWIVRCIQALIGIHWYRYEV